ncbi:MAG: DinB family protein, partial [Dehalococcoidia bacterium]
LAPATTRAEQFAAQFEAVNEAVIATVMGCTDAQWRQLSADEQWSVGVVAHHIAAVHRDFAGLLGTFAAGETRSPGSSMEAVHQSNAQHARDYAAVGKSETLETLRTNGATIGQLLRGFGDEQLEPTAGVFGGQELNVAQVVERIVIGHAAVHLASMRATSSGRAVDAG